MQICVDVGRLEVYRDTLKRAFGASAYMAIAECLVQTVLLTDDAGNPDVVSTAVLPKIPHSNSCKRVPNRPLRPRRPYYPAEADLEFQARACNTLAFGAVARSAAHRHRARRPAHWPRERTGAHTATMPWRSGRAAAKGVPLPQPQRRRPASVARRPREGPSLRRAAHLRTAGGAAGARAGGWDRPPRDGPPRTAPLDGVRNRRRAAATEVGAQTRSSAGHRRCVEPRKLLRAVAGRNSGRWGGVGRQAPSGPCDPCGRAVLLSHIIPFAFSVIATLPTLTRPQIPEDTNAECHL